MFQPGTPVVVALNWQVADTIGIQRTKGTIIGPHSDELWAVLLQTDKEILLVHRSRLSRDRSNRQKKLHFDPSEPL